MRRTLGFLSAIALLYGCGEELIIGVERTDAQPPTSGVANKQAADESKDLATLRRVATSFHDFETASRAGWSTQSTPCMMNATQGGMGFHYGNPKLIDGSVAVDEPELLLYEPEKNGRLRLVAVEYIVPLTEWKSAEPPRLFGRDFKVNEDFQVWALHAWVWENNPRGMFADWNPRITCENTTAVSTMPHH
jgi:hypothetical protein